ncbi:MAG TPA: hypothetical protein VK519_13645 [Pinirhizobacter sp.]|uniref:hypothetical protein n=1 Tax=Pinirhizobacter sp. TaxID=2950432 RepID=UPI002C1ED6CA|nr:hypothetical protein [Pinirhizobacter sp.]HMH68951.1 hypothetical protein [Pinirhizobacter sp.]
MLTHLMKFSWKDTQDAELDNAANDPLVREPRPLKAALAPGAQALTLQEEYELGGYAGI